MEHSLLNDLIIIFSACVLISALFNRFHMPTLVCYLLVGSLLGPYALDLVHDAKSLQSIAEFGVAFLLFTLGLEFSLSHLITLRRLVFGMGTTQVIACVITFSAANYLYGKLDPVGILITACAISLSSTAIVSKELSHRNEINTTHGQIAISILLFQDIAAIIILVLLSSIGQDSGKGLWAPLALMGLKALAYFVIMIAIGKWLLPRLFMEISKTKSEELFVLTVLVVALLSAAIAHQLGLAMAFGAFIAGMMLGESHFRHQIEQEIRPFRDVLLGIFFVSIGLQIDIGLITTYWPRILFFTVCLLIFKTSLIALLCFLFGNRGQVSLRTGLILSQGGEFGFVVLALAVKDQLIASDVVSFFSTIITLSMSVTPFLVSYSDKIAARLLIKREQKPNPEQDLPSHINESLINHVIICGYGRVGQIIARFLQQEKIPFIALDNDALRVKQARAAGEPVLFDNTDKLAALKKMGLMQAKLLIISFDDHIAARKMLTLIRQERTDLPVLVRTRDDFYLQELQNAGATEVIPETLEASLMLVTHVMAALGQPDERTSDAIQKVREERYKMLHGFIRGRDKKQGWPVHEIQLKSVLLPKSAYAVNKSLQALGLEDFCVSIESIHRGDKILLNPDRLMPLVYADLVILKGDADFLEAAESFLLTGKK
ncbi:MAG TPA: cation:proton antiporter [Pseudomonadales bacterium]|nr:cation:proton antiporter [Pseudomonadales bacterium]